MPNLNILPKIVIPISSLYNANSDLIREPLLSPIVALSIMPSTRLPFLTITSFPSRDLPIKSKSSGSKTENTSFPLTLICIS